MAEEDSIKSNVLFINSFYSKIINYIFKYIIYIHSLLAYVAYFVLNHIPILLIIVILEDRDESNESSFNILQTDRKSR